MKITKKAYILLLIIILQNILVIELMNNAFLERMEKVTFSYAVFMPLCTIILGVLAVFSAVSIIKFVKNEKEVMKKLSCSNEVIDALKAQKHDFKNHLNVISALLQLKNIEKAQEYIYKVNGKVDEAFSITKLENIEFAAILHTKVAIAESKGINVELDIETNLEKLKIDIVELCKIFFNLFDNAVYELENCKEEEKLLTVEIREFEENYIMIIGNSYPILSSKLYSKIFEKGFSTKQKEGRGYGLSIVKNLVEKNKGKIQVESYDALGTMFTVFLPR